MTRLFLYTFAALAAIFANSTKAAAQQFDEWFCDKLSGKNFDRDNSLF